MKMEQLYLVILMIQAIINIIVVILPIVIVPVMQMIVIAFILIWMNMKILELFT